MNHTGKKETVIGLDLGQMNDFTALVILEGERDQDEKLNALNVVHLERYRGEKYTTVADRVTRVFRALEGQGKKPVLVVDNTGVGRAVVDMLEHLKPVRVSIHGGNAVTNEKTREFGVPKRDIIGALVANFESGVLKIADGLELGPVLAREALNLKARISSTGHTELKADWREGDHDDLALALGIAVWYGSRPVSKLTRYPSRVWA